MIGRNLTNELGYPFFYDVLRGSGLSASEAKEYGPELFRRWMNLCQLRFKRIADNFSTVEFFKDLKSIDEMKKKLQAETEFYTKFIETKNKNFRIEYADYVNWPDGYSSRDVFVFECPPGEEVGYCKFKSKGRKFVLDFLQGRKFDATHKGFEIKKANKILGKPWFEFLMDRILESYRPLHDAGFGFEMRVPPGKEGLKDEHLRLFKKIRDRYLIKGGVSHKKALSLKKRRPQQMLQIKHRA